MKNRFKLKTLWMVATGILLIGIPIAFYLNSGSPNSTKSQEIPDINLINFLTKKEIQQIPPSRFTSLDRFFISSIQLKQLNLLTDSQLITVQWGFSLQQIKALDSTHLKWINPDLFKILDTEEIHKLPVQFLSQLNEKQFKILARHLTLGQLADLPASSIRFIPPDRLLELSVLEVNSLKDPFLEALNLEQIRSIEPFFLSKRLASLPSEIFSILNVAVLKKMAPSDIHQLTAFQLLQSSKEQLQFLSLHMKFPQLMALPKKLTPWIPDQRIKRFTPNEIRFLSRTGKIKRFSQEQIGLMKSFLPH